MAAVSFRSWVREVELEPSVYAADFLRLGEQVESLLAAGARIFHVDVGDGHFVPPVTIGPVVVRALAPLVHARGGRLDCHLMVADPEPHFGQIRAAGGDSVTFHVEAVVDARATAAAARELGLAVGLAFNPGTSAEEAAAAAEGADLVLCMSVVPGYSGQDFLPESIERLRRLRGLVAPEQLVQVDGGITAANVRAVREAGADLVVAGSAVFGPADVGAAYASLVRALG